MATSYSSHSRQRQILWADYFHASRPFLKLVPLPRMAFRSVVPYVVITSPPWYSDANEFK